MTAVIYARYSSDNQREESIEGQIRECTAYAEKNGITIVKHYIDRAISAKTDNRPEFQQMIKDSDKKLFDIVLVWKLDRFARNRYDSARYKTQLKKNGVKLMSATEIISEGPEGIILESVLEGYAEYYSADLSEKVIRGMTELEMYSINVQRFLRQILGSALFQKVSKGIGQQGIFRSGRLHFDFFHSGFLSAKIKHSSDYSQRTKKFDEYLFARR